MIQSLPTLLDPCAQGDELKAKVATKDVQDSPENDACPAEALLVHGAWVGTQAEWEALPASLKGEPLPADCSRPMTITEVIKSGTLGVPTLARKVLPKVLEKTGSKQKETRKLALDAALEIATALSPYGVKVVFPILLDFMGLKKRPEEREASLRILSLLADRHPEQMAWCLQDAVPPAMLSMSDIKPNVRKVAAEVIAKLCNVTGNRDIEPFIPVVTRCLKEPDFAIEAVDRLASVVFVQAVETPVLALMSPVLIRGLQVRKETTKRKACKIIDNMINLVPHPHELASFVPQLSPLIAKAKEEIGDPEAREVAERVFQSLEAARSALDKGIDALWLRAELQQLAPNAEADTLEYATDLSLSLTSSRCFESNVWIEELTSLGLTEESSKSALKLCFSATNHVEIEDEEEEGVDLCNCTFTLGYGNNTLLNNTRLHLKEGMCYALLGHNNCGKSTLMSAIDNGQLEGFPPKSERRTAFVEHGIGEAEPECDMLPEEYICSEPSISADIESGILTREDVLAELDNLGFKKGEKLDLPLGKMSTGWKMKTGLARAMLMKADILLLDEPTGHLDVKNVAWLTRYVAELKDACDKDGKKRPVTVLMTSHDSKFLESTATHVLNFEKRKLVMYKGKLSEFVEKVPSAKSYFELTTEKFKFEFPDPGFLEGVASRSRVIMKMSDVIFSYPGCTKPTLYGVGVNVSMFSRVAIVGPNGAGKSTMVKCLLGELQPTSGTIWKLPGSRVAYMAQHAFHHLEQHMHLTPTQYVLQRFAGFEDNESLEALAALGDHADQGPTLKMMFKGGELKECDSKINSKGEKEYVNASQALVVQQVMSRRRLQNKKKGFEYEVKWSGQGTETSWVEGELLAKMGFKRETQREDEKQAAMAGLQKRPLTTPAVEKHFAAFGVDAESATHTPLHSLSGGQKVKVVLAASMWLSPHLLVLDEPTNYLDRDALGALTQAIENWGGGIIVISHNEEFCNRICPEKWIMDAGHLRREGDTSGAGEEKAAASKMKSHEAGQLYKTVEDAAGMTVQVRTVAKTKKELQKELKDLEKEMRVLKKKGGVKGVSGSRVSDEDAAANEQFWELEDKINELKMEIDARED